MVQIKDSKIINYSLPTTGISTSLIVQAIGAESNDVVVCFTPNVNKWS